MIEPSSSLVYPLAYRLVLSQPVCLGSVRPPPQPTGPWLQEGSVVPPILAPTTRSASLDDSHGLPRCAGYTAGLCPTTWSGLPPRPALLWVNTPSLRAIAPMPRGETRIPQLSPRSLRLSATKQCVSSSISPDTSFRRGFAYAAAAFTSCYGPQGCWPSWTGPTWSFLRPPRTYTPELARGWSPKPRVGYDYTALLGKDDDRTYTGWSAAVTGCAFCRKLSKTGKLRFASH